MLLEDQAGGHVCGVLQGVSAVSTRQPSPVTAWEEAVSGEAEGPCVRRDLVRLVTGGECHGLAGNITEGPAIC